MVGDRPNDIDVTRGIPSGIRNNQIIRGERSGCGSEKFANYLAFLLVCEVRWELLSEQRGGAGPTLIPVNMSSADIREVDRCDCETQILNEPS